MSTSESTQTVQSTNQDPPIGTPAWIGIPATNILRAQKFYQEVFDWKFHNHYSGQYADRLSVFTIPGAPTLMVS
jgi:predicted enzyme related to lactoylglutathione lyase